MFSPHFRGDVGGVRRGKLDGAYLVRHGDGSVVRDGVDTVGITMTLSAGHRLRYRSGRTVSDGYPPIGGVTVLAPGEPARLSLSGRVLAIRLELPLDVMASWVEEDVHVDGARLAVRNSFHADDPVLRILLFEAMVGDGEEAGRAIAVHLVRSRGGGADAWVAGGLAPTRLRRVLDMVEQALPAELTLGGLAARAGMSPFHFSRAFRSTMGESPMRYVARRLALQSLQHLAAGGTSVEAIAHRTGFANASHLARHLRRTIGLTPARFRTLARSC